MKEAYLEQHPMGTLLGDPLPGAPELAARGKVTAGVRTITLVIPDQADVPAGMENGRYPRGDRHLQAEVWYPARVQAGDCPAVYLDHMGRADLGNLKPYPIPGRAYRDAAPDTEAGARPVVVISHGYPGSRMLLVNLAENLASKGYVTLAIGHTDNTYEDFLKAGSLESALIHRSMDQRFVIGQLGRLNDDGFLKGMLQPENVGLIGFSMGGYGALRTIGARMSKQALTDFAKIAHELGEEEGYRGIGTVKAAVLFAPAVFWFDPAQLADIQCPTLWFCGTSDRTVGYAAVRTCWEKSLHSDRILVSYERCGHNVANNPAPEAAKGESWEIYKRWADPVWDTGRLNNANAHFVTAFLDTLLKGDAEKKAYLETIRTPKNPGNLPGFTDGCSEGILLERLRKE